MAFLSMTRKPGANMILRHVLKKDLPEIEVMLTAWMGLRPDVLDILAGIVSAGYRGTTGCRILENQGAPCCLCLWIPGRASEIRILALAAGDNLPPETMEKFLRSQLQHWALLGMSRARIALPHSLAASLSSSLKNCGFMFESISPSPERMDGPVVRLRKDFLYRRVPGGEVMDFLREVLFSLGYEIRDEREGFGYRIREEFRLPFIFSPWHRITTSGDDIVIQPPARILEPHELETLFYPLRIITAHDRPLLVPMEARTALDLIDLPDLTERQHGLFGPLASYRPCGAHLSDISYTHPSALKGIRRGLPIVFYVNRIGAVGIGRVDDWKLEVPESLPDEMVPHVAATGPLAGKVLVLKFQWYQPFARPVSLDDIRNMDDSFNPQRTRAVAQDLFQSIVDFGSVR